MYICAGVCGGDAGEAGGGRRAGGVRAVYGHVRTVLPGGQPREHSRRLLPPDRTAARELCRVRRAQQRPVRAAQVNTGGSERPSV